MTTHPAQATAVPVRIVGPLLSAGAGLVGLAALAATDRDAAGVPCPFRAVTGLWCPGCGLTRAMRALLDGDVVAALGHNLLLPLALPAIVIAWWTWMRQALGRPPAPWLLRLATVPPACWWATGGAVLVFTVLRNLPMGDALAP